MIIQPIKTRIFQEGENLFAFITNYFKDIPEKSIIVVTSKIVALAEKRTAVVKNTQTKEKLIYKESEIAILTKYVWLTVKDGVAMASAGIDESNANGKLILLPRDSFKVAYNLRKKLRKKYQLRHLGVLIVDSRTIPLRAGIVGVSLGYAGFCGIRDYRGNSDIFGRKFKFSRTNIADGLASAAVLVMGEGNEQQPIVIIKKAPAKFCDKIYKNELHIDIKEDIYCPLFSKSLKLK
ncbi:MAG: coenzyme F420-0:L-glutamate ligase [Candidatus Paceibacterota bacterium]|jgi:F420-0:gamma-glutamyl ligase|nr:coenzyme F420-0:L-glutamate ligase [Candidatus Paceibacterota bacterium]MDD3072514.1 coenzyme F420-0:L-glutamate ligase [Candidatus Paceibacterota bacterium]MDD4201655.1 coenzyme F420-0:L-glutamate ligase [Candidatus Paceibacterota bacterium]MDD4467061.1 coenzyme F420-0:L-glutamate ligase [Candidatus Paceibacterota bacterium]MDD4897329.1 coenzyme F420-0:L-glutamate ligase [Candidatus Paceibacterota bacterium]